MREVLEYNSLAWNIDKNQGLLRNGVLDHHDVDVLGKTWKEATDIIKSQVERARFIYICSDIAEKNGCPRTGCTTCEFDTDRCHLHVDDNGIVSSTSVG